MRKLFLSATTALGLLASSATAAETPAIGVVNFATCITESKAGKKEQETMESMRKQMTSLVEETEKEMREIATKFEDPEYLDSLSPKAEEEMKIKFQTLQEDLQRYQNQFYQVLNQANYQMLQKMSSTISKAAKEVANVQHLDYVLNKEACFYVRDGLEVTTAVVDAMNKNYDLEMKAKNLSDTQENLQLNGIEESMVDQAG